MFRWLLACVAVVLLTCQAMAANPTQILSLDFRPVLATDGKTIPGVYDVGLWYSDQDAGQDARNTGTAVSILYDPAAVAPVMEDRTYRVGRLLRTYQVPTYRIWAPSLITTPQDQREPTGGRRVNVAFVDPYSQWPGTPDRPTPLALVRIRVLSYPATIGCQVRECAVGWAARSRGVVIPSP